MCRSMVDIQSPTAEIRGGKRRKKKMERNYWMKIYMVSLLHRATIKEEERTNHSVKIYMVSLFHRATINQKSDNYLAVNTHPVNVLTGNITFFDFCCFSSVM